MPGAGSARIAGAGAAAIDAADDAPPVVTAAGLMGFT
jgi:hypothetical protein